MISSIFKLILYQPLFNILILIYVVIPDFGIAIIILTFLIRLLLYPFSATSIKAQRNISRIQPKIKELQQKYKDDKEKQAKEILELYKTEKINPFSGFLFLIIQLPILIALYQLFWSGFKPEQASLLYSFIPNPGNITPYLFGVLNLATPNVILAFVAGILQFIQIKTSGVQNTAKKGDFASAMQAQMLYFFPILTVVFLFQLPAALGVYWAATTVFTIIQQYLTLRKP